MKKRIIALDYGLARIGVALSDEMKIIATPLKNILASKKSVDETVKIVATELAVIAEERECTFESIVIGIPYHMSGREGVQAEAVKVFAEKLKALVDAPIVLWDERLTTVQADRALREGNYSRKKRAQRVDGIAASIILQSYLDSPRIAQ